MPGINDPFGSSFAISKSKTKWSFGKASRFPAKKPLCDKFYQLCPKKQIKGRSTSLGYGSKKVFATNPQNQTPAGVVYYKESFTEQNARKNKGYSTKTSRSQVQPISYINLRASKTPGPGAYYSRKYNDSPQWNMRERRSMDFDVREEKRSLPGPGAYNEIKVINPVGRYSVSSYQSSKAPFFNPVTSKRFRQVANRSPGPSNYYPKNDFSNQGIYVLSQNRSSGRRRIPKDKKECFTETEAERSKAPGPGTYSQYSDFGSGFESHNFATTTQSNFIK